MMDKANKKIATSHEIAMNYASDSWSKLFYAYFNQIQNIYASKYLSTSDEERRKFFDNLIAQATKHNDEFIEKFNIDNFHGLSSIEINKSLLEDVLSSKKIISNIRRDKTIAIDKVIATSNTTQDIRKIYTTFTEIVSQYCVTGHYLDIKNPNMPDFSNFFQHFAFSAQMTIGTDGQSAPTYDASFRHTSEENKFTAELAGAAGTVTMAYLMSTGMTAMAAGPYALVVIAVVAVITYIKFSRDKVNASRERVAAQKKYWEDQARSIDVANYSRRYCVGFDKTVSKFDSILANIDRGETSGKELQVALKKMEDLLSTVNIEDNEKVHKAISSLNIEELFEFVLASSLNLYKNVKESEVSTFSKMLNNKSTLSNKLLRKRYRDLTIIEKQLRGRTYHEGLYLNTLSNNKELLKDEGLLRQFNSLETELYFNFAVYLENLTNFQIEDIELMTKKKTLKKQVNEVKNKVSNIIKSTKGAKKAESQLFKSLEHRLTKLIRFLRI